MVDRNREDLLQALREQSKERREYAGKERLDAERRAQLAEAKAKDAAIGNLIGMGAGALIGGFAGGAPGVMIGANMGGAAGRLATGNYDGVGPQFQRGINMAAQEYQRNQPLKASVEARHAFRESATGQETEMGPPSPFDPDSPAFEAPAPPDMPPAPSGITAGASPMDAMRGMIPSSEDLRRNAPPSAGAWTTTQGGQQVRPTTYLNDLELRRLARGIR